MEKVKKGDTEAFRQLYERFKKPLFSYFSLRTRKVGEAEELTQELFMRVYTSRLSYEPTAKLSTWLWTIARNLCIDHSRKKQEVTGIEPEIMDREEDPLSSADELLIQNAELKQLERCIDELNPDQKEATLLRTFSEAPYDEIASLLGTSLGNVKSLLFRAKQLLIECFRKRGYHAQ